MKNIGNRKQFEFQVGTEHKTGKPVMMNLIDFSNILVTGKTGSGKTQSLHNWILKLMANNTPDDIQFFIIDPKRVEYSNYIDSPYLPTNPILDETHARAFLGWLEENVKHRYDYLRKTKTLSIDEYNQKIAEHPTWAKEQNLRHFAHQVVVIDELASYTVYLPNFRACLVRLMETAKLAGVHFILATQNPTVEVIGAEIKNNSTHISLRQTSDPKSRETFIESWLNPVVVKLPNYTDYNKEKATLKLYQDKYPRAKQIDWEQELIDWGKAKYIDGSLTLIEDEMTAVREKEKAELPPYVNNYLKECKADGLRLDEAFDFTETPHHIIAWFTEKRINSELFAKAWIEDDWNTIPKHLYIVKSGNTFFGGWEDTTPKVVISDLLGFEDYVKFFDTKEEAKSVAKHLGWEVEDYQSYVNELKEE